MRTTRELRQQEHIPIPINPDSVYKPIEREEKVLPEIKIPAKLQKELPFKVQEKTRAIIEKKKEKKEKEKLRPDDIPEKLIVDHNERKKSLVCELHNI